MAIRKPDFITRHIRGGRPVSTRPYKWAPGIPSLAIEFKEIPEENVTRIPSEEVIGDVLGNEDGFAILTANGYMIGIIEPEIFEDVLGDQNGFSVLTQTDSMIGIQPIIQNVLGDQNSLPIATQGSSMIEISLP